LAAAAAQLLVATFFPCTGVAPVRVKIAIPEAHVSKPVLDAGLEAVTRLNEQMLAAGEIPLFDDAVKDGLRWAPEPPGDEHFDHGQKLVQRNKGDCDDIAPYKAATLRHTGEDPDARAEVYRSGPTRWHAIVRRGDGSMDDPSRQAGMKRGIAPMTRQEMQGVYGHEHSAVLGVVGATLPLMFRPQSCVGDDVGAYILRPQIAIRPFGNTLQARADLPWQYQTNQYRGNPSNADLALTALHSAPVASAALTGAIQGVLDLAEANGCGDPGHLNRLCAIADGCEGASFDELVRVYGEEDALNAAAVLGSIFGKLGKLAKGVAKGAFKIALPAAASFIPGGSAALRAVKSGAKLLRGRPRAAPARAAPPVSARPRPIIHRPPGVVAPRPIIHRPPGVVAPRPAAKPVDSHFAAVDDKRNVTIHIHGPRY
jgi:hypothetical protein